VASLDDILTATKNAVTAINNASQTYLNIQGAQNVPQISTTTQVRTGAGRLAMVSITSPGTTNGTIYDSSSTSSLTVPIYTIPTTIGIMFVNMPVSFGIVVVPGSGQVVTVSYS
jgi:hypothetical protein